jgi:hypothetical protein
MPRKLNTVVADPPEDSAVKVEVMLPVRSCRRDCGRKDQNGHGSHPSGGPRIPRIARLMALAIKFQDMVDRGEVDDYADLARLGYVTRARITQIMNLLNLAPDLQEQILFAGDAQGLGGQPFERQLRPVLSVVDWPNQRMRMREALQRPTAGYSNMTI